MGDSHQAPDNPYAAPYTPSTELQARADSLPPRPTSIMGAVTTGVVRGFRFGAKVSGGICGAFAVVGLLVMLLKPGLFPERNRIHTLWDLARSLAGGVGGTLVGALWGAVIGALIWGVWSALSWRHRSGG